MTQFNLKNENGNVFTDDIEKITRPYIKSLTPEQFEEDKNWWTTALEVTGNLQPSFTIGQIIGNKISEAWDIIPALHRIKEWHKQNTDPQRAMIDEAGHVAVYFMATHPRQTFQFIDRNGGKKGNAARYKMLSLKPELTLASNINWVRNNRVSWQLGNTRFNGVANSLPEFFEQVVKALNALHPGLLKQYIYDNIISESDDWLIDVSAGVITNREGTLVGIDYDLGDMICSNVCDAMPETSRVQIEEFTGYEWSEIIPDLLYVWNDISNTDVIKNLKYMFSLFEVSPEELKIKLI